MPPHLRSAAARTALVNTSNSSTAPIWGFETIADVHGYPNEIMYAGLPGDLATFKAAIQRGCRVQSINASNFDGDFCDSENMRQSLVRAISVGVIYLSCHRLNKPKPATRIENIVTEQAFSHYRRGQTALLRNTNTNQEWYQSGLKAYFCRNTQDLPVMELITALASQIVFEGEAPVNLGFVSKRDDHPGDPSVHVHAIHDQHDPTIDVETIWVYVLLDPAGFKMLQIQPIVPPGNLPSMGYRPTSVDLEYQNAQVTTTTGGSNWFRQSSAGLQSSSDFFATQVLNGPSSRNALVLSGSLSPGGSIVAAQPQALRPQAPTFTLDPIFYHNSGPIASLMPNLPPATLKAINAYITCPSAYNLLVATLGVSDMPFSACLMRNPHYNPATCTPDVVADLIERAVALLGLCHGIDPYIMSEGDGRTLSRALFDELRHFRGVEVPSMPNTAEYEVLRKRFAVGLASARADLTYTGAEPRPAGARTLQHYGWTIEHTAEESNTIRAEEEKDFHEMFGPNARDATMLNQHGVLRYNSTRKGTPVGSVKED